MTIEAVLKTEDGLSFDSRDRADFLRGKIRPGLYYIFYTGALPGGVFFASSIEIARNGSLLPDDTRLIGVASSMAGAQDLVFSIAVEAYGKTGDLVLKEYLAADVTNT